MLRLLILLFVVGVDGLGVGAGVGLAVSTKYALLTQPDLPFTEPYK